MVVAISLADSSTRWTALNVTATKLYVADDVLVAAVDTQPLFGHNSNVQMVRGFSLADGQLLWQRTADHGIGFRIGRACDIDCSLPCNLVAAGPFGAIDPKTGQAMYNVTTAPLPQSELDTLATALGVAYYVNQPIDITSGHDDTTTRNNSRRIARIKSKSHIHKRSSRTTKTIL